MFQYDRLKYGAGVATCYNVIDERDGIVGCRIDCRKLKGIDEVSAVQVTVTWMFYMLTLLRKRLGLTWDEFDAVQREYHLSAFLLKQYDLLHYYDNDYIVDNTFIHIKEQGGDIRELQRVG
jgi:hypothetical protein